MRGNFLNTIEEVRGSRALYLFLAFILNILLVLGISLLVLNWNFNFGIFPVVFAVFNGAFAWLFMNNHDKYILFLYSLFYSFLSYFLFHILFFIHNFHWESTLVFDKSYLSFGLLLKYLSIITKPVIAAFSKYYSGVFNTSFAIGFFAMVIPLFQFKLYGIIDLKSASNEDPPNRNRIIKRKFD